MFEKLFFLLIPYINSTESIRSLIAEIQDLIANERADATSKMRESYAAMQSDHDKQVHELLVTVCLANPRVYDWAGSQKITAIKALRNIVGFQNASLVQAKNAVEDQRVYDKWTTQHTVSTDPELADHNSNYQQGMTKECSE